MLAAVTILLSVCIILAPSSTLASPASQNFVKSLQNGHQMQRLEQPDQSVHMRIADRLLKRVLDLTYDTLKDIGASEEDLSSVQHKRNYIQTCYFHAISCY